MKHYIIIGHRGTGKSKWIQEMSLYFKKKNIDVRCMDLDTEIEKESGTTIEELFKKGENYFRDLENEVAHNCFNKIKGSSAVNWISVGAGFTGDIPADFYVIHLQRLSDKSGRIFFDRPRIIPNISAYEESIKLYSKRQPIYQTQRDSVFTQLDHYSGLQIWDQIFLDGSSLPFSNGVLTLNPNTTPCDSNKLKFFLNKRLSWGLKYFELRDDQVDLDFLNQVLKYIPSDKILLSLRKKGSTLFKENIRESHLAYDVPYEWIQKKEEFSLSDINLKILSLHEVDKSISLEDQLKSFSKLGEFHLKLAIPISSFKELIMCHQWQRENPFGRSFHPSSEDGRWKWYRLLFNPHQNLYFIKEDIFQGVMDQPCLAESIRVGSGIGAQGFSAVIGEPIEHSRTPSEQEVFFKNYQMPVVPILIKEKEMNLQNINILKQLGLKFTAVTSPLKKNAYELIQNKSDTPVVNTLSLLDPQIKGYNTDLEGAYSIKKNLKKEVIAVWGGGGVRPSLRLALDTAHFFSARTGQSIEDLDLENFYPNIIIWAVGRSRMSQCLYPPIHWKPDIVYDLNYTEDSPAREYSLKQSATYVSGIRWFTAQARKQREIFKVMNEDN